MTGFLKAPAIRLTHASLDEEETRRLPRGVDRFGSTPLAQLLRLQRSGDWPREAMAEQR
ncbi:hypothetical protein Pmi06nite_57560 [Planotetraspora mira]|uniref:Uncharacterized protein n=1 Tax=Planotetraspora mira TaxID=58121 RepID=A0A8J3X9U8_9ACTN|nr:hypothetical protein Pmi06nite_57560 [Planotetraspora mira]